MSPDALALLDTADDDQVDAVVALWRAAHEADVPRDPRFCTRWERGRITLPLPEEDTEVLLACGAGGLSGVAELGYPLLDNPATALLRVTVHPAARRRGLGRALHAAAQERIRARGRKLVTTWNRADAAAEAFARSVGARQCLAVVRNRLVVDAAAHAAADAAWEAAVPHAGAYEIHTFAGDVPDAFVSGIAYLSGRMSTDMPTDDLEQDPEIFDVARIRSREAVLGARGRRNYTAVAVHTGSGEVAGFTDLALPPDDPTAGWVGDTIVDPAHRGHRLGLLLKAANLRLVAGHEPALRTVMTFNALSNRHMLAVNTALGYRLWDRFAGWQSQL